MNSNNINKLNIFEKYEKSFVNKVIDKTYNIIIDNPII